MNTAEKKEDPTLLVRRCIDCCQGFKKNRLAIDVGAYAGLWTALLAEEFQHVFAFEPIDEHFVLLKSNTQHLINVSCCQKAITDRHTHFGVMRKKDDWTLIQGPNPVDERLLDFIRVSITTIDLLNLADVDFIKINTNGGEYEVVAGAMETITSQKPLVLVNENRDPHRRASSLLKYCGMQELLVWDRNYLFGW